MDNWDSEYLVPKKSMYRKYDRRSFRTKRISKAVQIIVACPKGSWSARSGQCRAGMKGVVLRRRRKRGKRRTSVRSRRRNMRRPRRRVHNRRRKWIRGAIKRPGALRRKFTKWYGLKPNQKIPHSMYVKGYKRAKRRGDTRTLRQINLAKTLGTLRRRKGKVVRMRRPVRRVAANRRRRVRRRRR